MFWILHAFFWVILRRLNFMCQCLRTHCLSHLHRRLWRWNRHSVLKCWHIKFRRRGIIQKKAYSIENMTKVWNQELNSYVYTDMSDVMQFAEYTLECQHWFLNASTFVSNIAYKISVLEFLCLFCSGRVPVWFYEAVHTKFLEVWWWRWLFWFVWWEEL